MALRSRNPEGPLYIRWIPTDGAVALELRLDLIPEMRKAVDEAALAGMEAGGLFLGTTPDPLNPTIRIDGMVLIHRRPEDGAVFMMDPKEHDRFLTTRWDTRTGGRAVVGFFRSHLRQGVMRPSLADKTLLHADAANPGSVVLLIKPGRQQSAAFFLRSKSGIPEQPSIPEFILHESSFTELPEVDPGGERIPNARRSGGLRGWLLPFEICGVAALGIASVPLWMSDPGGLGLTVGGTGTMQVSWNHSASELRRAQGGRVTIVDGAKRSEVPLTSDDLRFGSVNYRPLTGSVEVTFSVEMPGATSVVQSATWHPNP